MSKTFAFLMATSLAATSAMPALAGGLDDAIIEAPVAVEPAPAVGGFGTVGAIVGGLVALGIIAAVVSDDDDDDDDNGDGANGGGGGGGNGGGGGGGTATQ